MHEFKNPIGLKTLYMSLVKFNPELIYPFGLVIIQNI